MSRIRQMLCQFLKTLFFIWLAIDDSPLPTPHAHKLHKRHCYAPPLPPQNAPPFWCRGRLPPHCAVFALPWGENGAPPATKAVLRSLCITPCVLSLSGWFAPSMGQKVKRGALLKVYVHPLKKRNNECGPAWKTLRTLTSIKARPEAHICCALPLGKGTTLTVETRHNSCTLQDTLSMQRVIQRLLITEAYVEHHSQSTQE